MPHMDGGADDGLGRALAPNGHRPRRQQMKPAPFLYHRAHDVEEALELLSEHGDEAKVLAGGQSLMILMNFRLARPEVIVDIDSLTELHDIERIGDELRIGALVRHRRVEVGLGADFAGFDLLSRAARYIGHYPIRTRGTFGGSIAHADPTAEWCILALLLDAEIDIRSERSTRSVAARDFFRGFLSTALDATELVTAIRFPTLPGTSSIHECCRRAGDFAIVAAAADLNIVDDRCRGVRIALGGVGPTPLRATEAESMLAGEPLSDAAIDAAARAAADAIDPPSDQHGSSSYRRTLTHVLVRRCLTEAAEQALEHRR